jgi:hypothetical protein
VLHTVVNTAEPVAADRVRFYIDGTSVPAAMGSSNAPPTQGELLALAATDQLSLMNRPTGDRPLVGTLYYLAVYATALDAAAVATNASLLDQDDDG